MQRRDYQPVSTDSSGRLAVAVRSSPTPTLIALGLAATVLVLWLSSGPETGAAVSRPELVTYIPPRPTDIFQPRPDRSARLTPPPPPSPAPPPAQLLVRAQAATTPDQRAVRPPPAGCGGAASAECSVERLVRHYAVDNTVLVTFGNARQRHFTANWVYHIQNVGVRAGLLVGMMNMQPTDALYVPFAASLRARGVGVYCVNSAEVKLAPQGGRWFHVLPLLRTGVRLILSDSDIAWLRDPAPYLRALEAHHPKLDFAVSTDAQAPLDERRLGASPDTSSDPSAELDVEKWGQCFASMNIGVMLFPPGARPGAITALVEATTHLLEDGNLRRVDQGPINYRWKFGYRKYKWHRTLFPVADASGKRLCGLTNGNVTGAVLPAAQFCNTMTHDLLQLWKQAGVRPFAVHATWMRRQEEPWKLMRLREQGLWFDAPRWYGLPPRTQLADDASGWMVPVEPRHRRDDPAWQLEQEATVGFLTYDSRLPSELLSVSRLEPGGVPMHHMRLMHAQLRKLRSALFVARLLKRALVLPATLCSCELGFFVSHVKENCRAADHQTLPLPYVCPIDHYLFPRALATSPFAHRERTFLDNSRAAHINASVRLRVVPAAGSSPPFGARTLARGASERELVSTLGGSGAAVLHFEEIEAALGSFGSAQKAKEWHGQAQELLDAYCCTSSEIFKAKASGGVPYLLPPLPGQTAWLGAPRLEWARTELARMFREAGDAQIAAELEPWSVARA